MNYFKATMMCQMCPDKKRAKSSLNDATRIYQRMQQMLDHNQQKTRENKKHHPLFDSHLSCHYTGSSCSEFSRTARELRMMEEKLEICFHRVIKSFENLEVEKIKTLKHQLFEICRGHYPKAASLIQRSYT